MSDDLIRSLALEARAAARRLAALDAPAKDAALLAIGRALRDPDATREVLAAAARDEADARAKGLSAALVDRLRLDERGLASLARACDEVAGLPDPVGEVVERRTRPNGLEVERVRVPLGVIAMIYEARPNVTVEAAALCLKSGNAAVLRGGAEALRTNLALERLMASAVREHGVPPGFARLIPRADRDDVRRLVQLDDLVDVAIPRGGEGLIRAVAEHARVPVLRHYKGVCHVYVDAAADLDAARSIVVNAKCQRPGVCNAAECLLVHRDLAARALPAIASDLIARGVELRGDDETRALVPLARAAAPDDYGREFLDLILAVRVVASLDEALEHIARFGSNHTEAIVSRDEAAIARFLREVDASCVVANASTRFNDGGELGLGAEIGISTTKLHAYGPMGLRELTTTRFVVRGAGQVRESR